MALEILICAAIALVIVLTFAAGAICTAGLLFACWLCWNLKEFG